MQMYLGDYVIGEGQNVCMMGKAGFFCCPENMPLLGKGRNFLQVIRLSVEQ